MRRRLEACSSARWWPAQQPGTGSARSPGLRSRSAWPASSRGSSWGLPLSTLALDGSRGLSNGGWGQKVLRYGDLVLLALALPAFIIAGWPLLGYVVAAAAWLAQRGIQILAARRVVRSLAGDDRRAALGTVAAAMLGRIWLIALAVLIVGLIERQAGLAAALLSAALFTFYFGAQVLERLLYPQRHQPGSGADAPSSTHLEARQP